MLARLRSHGLTVRADGDRVIVSPRTSLTEELRAMIRANKAGILRELEAEAMCDACARDEPGQCDRRAPPEWLSCWALAYPERLIEGL